MKKRKKVVKAKPRKNASVVPTGIWSVIQKDGEFYVVNRKSVFGPYEKRTNATQHARDLNTAKVSPIPELLR